MIDPHTHSTASDGTLCPRDLMKAGSAAGLTIIGLTDHDTIAGWEEASAALSCAGLALLRGMEMSIQIEGEVYHLLAYLFSPSDERLRNHCEVVARSRRERAQRIVERLGEVMDLSWHEVYEVARTKSSRGKETSSDVILGRPHIADAMVSRGIVASRREAFERYLGAHSPYYLPHYAPPACEAIEWVRSAGGQCVLAHPRSRTRGRALKDATVRELAEVGLFGIEVDHREHSPRDVAELALLAERFHLARFGSSDYHGAGKPNHLGERTTAPAVVELLIANCQMEVLRP